jgi:hypothetical protein
MLSIRDEGFLLFFLFFLCFGSNSPNFASGGGFNPDGALTPERSGDLW